MKKRRLNEDLSWDDFSDPETDAIEREFLPSTGEGDSMATQAVTAVVKLVYKWFNDGDVFDNTYSLGGWANDLSSYANWLYEYLPETEDILMGIKEVHSEADYTQLLYDLMHAVLNRGFLSGLVDKPIVDSIYECRGPFKFEEQSDWDEDEDDDDWY